MIAQILYIISSALLLLITLLPLSNSGHWLIRDAEFPRLQLLFWATLNSILAIFFWAPSIIFGTAVATNIACGLYQLYWIYKFFPLYPVEVNTATIIDEKKSIIILSANVLMTNSKYKNLIELVKNHRPDILISLESNSEWQQRIDQLEPEYAHSIKVPQDNLYGMHIYSKFPFKKHCVEYLINENVPSVHCIVTLPCGVDFNLRVLHPMPPSPTERSTSVQRDVELIIVAKKISRQNTPTIIAGDLNDVAWSKTTEMFKQISGLKDPRVGRGFFNTFHAQYPFLRWPLDHLFHSNHFQLVDMQRLFLKGSDHFALLAHLQLSNLSAEDHPTKDIADQALKKRRLKEANESASTEDVPTLTE